MADDTKSLQELIDELPIGTQISIFPIDEFDYSAGRVYQVKNERITSTGLGKDITLAIEDFLKYWEDNAKQG